MRIMTYSLLALILLTGLSSAYDVKIIGDQIISKSELVGIIDRLSQETRRDILPALVSKEVGDSAEKKGFLDARLNLILANDSLWELTIASGQLYGIGTVIPTFQGDRNDDLREFLEDGFEKKPATQENLLGILEESVAFMSDRGYPFTQAKLISLQKIPPNQLNLGLEMTCGPFIRIDSLIFIGNDHFSTGFLRHQSGWHIGIPFSQFALDNSIDNLNSLGYLRVEGAPAEHYYDNYKSCLLTYKIARQRLTRLEGAVGYNPGTAQVKGFLFGLLDWSFYSPFGDGKNFSLRWNRPRESSFKLLFEFQYPFLFGTDFNSFWQINQERYSDFYLSLSCRLRLELILTPSSQLEMGLGWTRLNAQGKSFKSVYDSRVYEASLGFGSSSTRDYKSSISGRSLQGRLTYLRKRLYATLGTAPKENSINPFRAEISFWFGAKWSRHIFSNIRTSFNGFSGNESLLSPAEMIKLGGRQTLRGYSEEQFLTSRAVWANLEWGMYQATSFKGFLFTDLGYARLSDIHALISSPRYSDRFLIGAGIGFGLSSGQTGVDLNLGWGKKNHLGEGKLYLILENSF